MFEISIPKIKNCIRNMEQQEKEMQRLVERMDAVCADFDGLMEDKSDKRALLKSLEEMKAKKKGMTDMRCTLSEILKCYVETEKRIADSYKAFGVRNQFGLSDLSGVGQMLDSLNIIFK